MANERIPPADGRATPKADNPQQESTNERSQVEAEVVLPGVATLDAERSRRIAEEIRQRREQHREEAEVFRRAQEGLRDAAETARAAAEDARLAAEEARHAVIDSVRATAESLKASLVQMTVVEEMRRTLREIRDIRKPDSN